MKRTLICLIMVVAISIIYLEHIYGEEIAYRPIEDTVPTIIVKGTGKITAKPDEAVVKLGIINEEKSLKRAFERQTEEMNKLIEEIKALGIEEEDIKTTSYNVIPIYKGSKVFWGRQKPTSFEVSHQLTVKVKDLSMVGDLIDKVIEAGAIFVYGLEFRHSKIEELERQARLAAAEDAKKKALMLAEGVGFKLGRILKVDEAMEWPEAAPKLHRARYEEMRDFVAEEAPRIEPGLLELRATCTVIYEIAE